MTDGVIAHTLLLTTQYSQMATPTASAIGIGWPVNGADYDCAATGPPTSCTGSLPWGSLVAIPQSYNCSAHSYSVYGVMLCVALQNYGAIQNQNSGNASTPTTGLKAEYAPSNAAYQTAMSEMSTDWQSISSQLRIITNNTPANFYAGSPTYAKGGGAPLVAQQAGIVQGLSAINFSPPVFVTNVIAPDYACGSCNSFTTIAPIPQNTSGFMAISTSCTSIGTVIDSSGDSWTVRKTSATNTGHYTMIVDAINKAHTLPAGGTISWTNSGCGNTSLNVVTTAGVNGGADASAGACTTSNSTSSFSVSTGALAQAKEFIFGILDGAWMSPDFESMPGLVEGLSGVEVGDGLHWGSSYGVNLVGTSSVAYASTFSAGGTVHGTGCVQAYKMPYLLQRDLDPSSNDNTPAFLNRAA